MPNIRITMSVQHDATDPNADDTTMDLNDLILKNFFNDLENFEIVERAPQALIVQFTVPVEDPSQFHIED